MFFKKKKKEKKRELQEKIDFIIKQMSSIPLLEDYNFYRMKKSSVYCVESKKNQKRYIAHYNPTEKNIKWNESKLFSDPYMWKIYIDQKSFTQLNFKSWLKQLCKDYV